MGVEHETEIDLTDDAVAEAEDQEFEDRGDDLTPEQVEAWEQDEDADDEVEADDDAEQGDDEGRPDDAGDNAEVDADAGTDDADTEKRGSRTVPHGRFNEVNEQLKQERAERLRLEEELARARGSQQAQQPEQPEATEEQVQQAQDASDFDFDDAETRYSEAIYDGDMEQAKQIRAEIRVAERKAAEDAARAVLEQERSQMAQAQQQQELQATVSKAYEQYPFLNPDDTGMNQDAIDEVVALRDLYLKRGEAPADAIAKAVDKVGPRYGKPVGKGALDETLTQQKKREAIERNQERADRIPPSGDGTGERARKVDYSRLSDDEFDNLPESEKKKARGDYL